MSTLHTSTSPKPLAKKLQAREAVLLIFCDPLPEQYARLWHLSDHVGVGIGDEVATKVRDPRSRSN